MSTYKVIGSAAVNDTPPGETFEGDDDDPVIQGNVEGGFIKKVADKKAAPSADIEHEDKE